MRIAEQGSVSPPAGKDTLVLYSGRGGKNFVAAREHASADTKAYTIEDTQAGRELHEADLFGSNSPLTYHEATDVWATASKRCVKEAPSHVRTFIIGSRERSIFRTHELKEILAHQGVREVNGVPAQAIGKVEGKLPSPAVNASICEAELSKYTGDLAVEMQHEFADQISADIAVARRNLDKFVMMPGVSAEGRARAIDAARDTYKKLCKIAARCPGVMQKIQQREIKADIEQECGAKLQDKGFDKKRQYEVGA